MTVLRDKDSGIVRGGNNGARVTARVGKQPTQRRGGVSLTSAARAVQKSSAAAKVLHNPAPGRRQTPTQCQPWRSAWRPEASGNAGLRPREQNWAVLR